MFVKGLGRTDAPGRGRPGIESHSLVRFIPEALDLRSAQADWTAKG